MGQVPVDRGSEHAADDVARAANEVFARGDLFGIYPEGTRSPDGRIYRGHTGVARLGLASGHDIVPVGMIGSRKANPIGSWIPRPHTVRMVVGEPIHPVQWAHEHGYDPATPEAARALTDHLMHTLSALTGYPYVDAYATGVKKSLEQAEGYPQGTEPGGELETRPEKMRG